MYRVCSIYHHKLSVTLKIHQWPISFPEEKKSYYIEVLFEISGMSSILFNHHDYIQLVTYPHPLSLLYFTLNIAGKESRKQIIN